MYPLKILIYFSFLFTFTHNASATWIRGEDGRIVTQGRSIISEDGGRVMYWPGTSVKIFFKGTSLEAKMEGCEIGNNYFTVILDGKVLPDKIKVGKGRNTYLLAKSLKKNKNHSLELYIQTDTLEGKVLFHGFQLPKGSVVYSPSKKKSLNIEFYGDSNTSGFSIDYPDKSKDNDKTIYKNNDDSYASITSRNSISLWADFMEEV